VLAPAKPLTALPGGWSGPSTALLSAMGRAS